MDIHVVRLAGSTVMRHVAAFLLALGLGACSRSEYVQVMDLPLTAPGEGRTEVLAALPIGTKCEVVKAAIQRYFWENERYWLGEDKEERYFSKPRVIACGTPDEPAGCLADALFPSRFFTAKRVKLQGQDFFGVGFRGDTRYSVAGKIDAPDGEGVGGLSYTVRAHQYGSIGACKRVGVLPSKTEGMHDLVCNDSYVTRWNGDKYP